MHLSVRPYLLLLLDTSKTAGIICEDGLFQVLLRQIKQSGPQAEGKLCRLCGLQMEGCSLEGRSTGALQVPAGQQYQGSACAILHGAACLGQDYRRNANLGL